MHLQNKNKIKISLLFVALQRPVRFSFREYLRPLRDAADQLGRKVSETGRFQRLLDARRHSTHCCIIRHCRE